jgi:hypothetical protein
LLQFREEGRGGGRRRFLLIFKMFFLGDAISVTVSNVSPDTQPYPQFRGSGGLPCALSFFPYLRSRTHRESCGGCSFERFATKKKNPAKKIRKTNVCAGGLSSGWGLPSPNSLTHSPTQHSSRMLTHKLHNMHAHSSLN